VLRFAEGYYKQTGRSATVGAFFLTKRLTCQGITCKMLLWDTAGQEQFRKLAITYYKNAAAAILCFDVSNPQSLHRLRRWLQELQANVRIVITIAACKCDLEPVPYLEKEAKALAESVNALYVRTSAKTNQGVEELFQKTAARVLQWQQEAAQGQAPALKVTLGGQGNSRSNRRSLSPYPATPKKFEVEKTVDPGETHHHETATNESDHENPVVETKSSSPTGVMCNSIDGSLLVCGGDEASKSCNIM